MIDRAEELRLTPKPEKPVTVSFIVIGLFWACLLASCIGIFVGLLT